VTLVAVPVLSPEVAACFDGASSNPASNIDASGEKVAFVLHVPKTGNIRKIGFGLGTVTTGQTLRAGLYTVDANGDPTTTAYGGMAAGTVAVADTDDTLPKLVTLATDAAAVRNDVVAVVIEFDSTAGNLAISAASAGAAQFPHVSLLTASWAKSVTSLPLCVLEYDDGTVAQIPGVFPFYRMSEETYNSGTATADEYGLKWTQRFPARLCGVVLALDATAAADYEVVLYDGTTAVQTVSRDGDIGSVVSGERRLTVLFDTPQALAVGDVRRITLKPTTTTNIGLVYGLLHAAAHQAAFLGADAHMTRRLNLGSWDDSLTDRVPTVYPLYDQLDDGAGGGGGGLLTHPGMAGGMRA
jgi:hypothetical protein